MEIGKDAKLEDVIDQVDTSKLQSPALKPVVDASDVMPLDVQDALDDQPQMSFSGRSGILGNSPQGMNIDDVDLGNVSMSQHKDDKLTQSQLLKRMLEAEERDN